MLANDYCFGESLTTHELSEMVFKAFPQLRILLFRWQLSDDNEKTGDHAVARAMNRGFAGDPLRKATTFRISR